MISMHACIAIMLELPFFAGIMIIWNLTNFYNFENQSINDKN